MGLQTSAGGRAGPGRGHSPESRAGVLGRGLDSAGGWGCEAGLHLPLELPGGHGLLDTQQQARARPVGSGSLSPSLRDCFSLQK